MKELDKVNQDKRSLGSNIKASFTTKKFRGGAYAATLSAIVIIVILLVNIFVTELDLKVDVSGEGMYTLTDVTKDYLKNIEDKIEIYYLAQTGMEDSTFTEIVKKYENLSSNIKVVYKDPVLYPNFAAGYVDDTVTNNSVLVVNQTNGRAKYVDSNDMILYEIDYSTYQSYATGIDVEGQITSAIQYVTTENLPLMYLVEGHGETSLADTLAASLVKINVTTDTLSTITLESIPEDCSILLINAPQTDYSLEEVAMIKEYLSAGGDAIIFADYSSNGLVNFNGLLNYYGISLTEGVVLEGSQSYYMGQYINNLVPLVQSHDITTDIKSNKTSIVAPTASGIQILDTARSTLEIEALLTTSSEAYSKVDINSPNVDKEDGDITGPFDLGVVVTETYNDIQTKLIVYGSSYLIDESMVSYTSIGNLDLILNSVNYVSDQESPLTIRTRSLTQEYLTMNAAQVNFLAVLVVGIIPVFILVIGGFVCIRRRRK